MLEIRILNVPSRPPVKLPQKKHVRSIRSNSTNDSGVMISTDQGSSSNSNVGSNSGHAKNMVVYQQNLSQSLDDRDVDPWNLSSLSNFSSGASLIKENMEKFKLVPPIRTTSLQYQTSNLCKVPSVYNKPLPQKVVPIKLKKSYSIESLDDFKDVLEELDCLVKELKDMVLNCPSEPKIQEIQAPLAIVTEENANTVTRGQTCHSSSGSKSSFINNLPKIDEETSSSDEFQEEIYDSVRGKISPISCTASNSAKRSDSNSSEKMLAKVRFIRAQNSQSESSGSGSVDTRDTRDKFNDATDSIETHSCEGVNSSIGTASIVEKIVKDNRKNNLDCKDKVVNKEPPIRYLKQIEATLQVIELWATTSVPDFDNESMLIAIEQVSDLIRLNLLDLERNDIIGGSSQGFVFYLNF